MADYRPFGASNEPDTCIWCGKKLRHRQVTAKMTVGDAKAKGHKLSRTQQSMKDDWHVEVVIGYKEKGGDYVDGHFCGLRCGYMFGVAMADNGRRLQPKE